MEKYEYVGKKVKIRRAYATCATPWCGRVGTIVKIIPTSDFPYKVQFSNEVTDTNVYKFEELDFDVSTQLSLDL